MKYLFPLIPLVAVMLISACNNSDDEGSPGKADLELSFEPISEKPEIGGLATFEIQLYNRGPLAADGILIESFLPAGYTQVQNINAGGVNNGGTIRWQVEALNADETISLSFSALAEKPFGDSDFTHRAQVLASNQSDPDSTPGNVVGDPKEDDEAALTLFPKAGSLSLNFKTFYGEDPLVMFGREYAYEDNMALKMQLFQFYISEVHLLKGTEEEDLLDVSLISFGDVYTDQEAADGKSTSTVILSPGNYTGIQFGFGLSPSLNATLPPDYPLGHPLSENYWEAAGSYIFFKFEGNADLEPNGDFSDKLTFHVGGNENYRQLSFDKPITVEDEAEVVLQFNIDLKKILVDQSSGEYLDFRQVTQSHSNSSPSASFMADHVSGAVELE